MNINYKILAPFSILILFWVSMLIIFTQTSNDIEIMPEIAKQGLNDIWFFYLPLLLFTLITIFFFTRKRERPTWENFSVNKNTIKKDLIVVISYLIVTQIFLGSIVEVGLHFPGPEVYDTKSHGVFDVTQWVIIQSFFYIFMPYVWLRRQGFTIKKMWSGINFKRDIWIIIAFWLGDFFGVLSITNFNEVALNDYFYAIPLGILVNTLGAGLPVLIIVHIIIIPRLSLLLNNQLLVIMLAGICYALFSIFDPGVSYSSSPEAVASLSYIFATQTLIGMGKASFTVRTGNPFIHFTSYHILGARVAFDTAMYAEVFRS